MTRARAACSNCSLPFYTDTNDECPYCSTPVGGPDDTTAAPGRTRTTCPDCGLPHYGDDCPYCAAADGGVVSATSAGGEPEEGAESESEPEPESQPEPPAGPGTDDPPSAGDAPGGRSQHEPGEAGGSEDDSPNTFLGRLARMLFGR